MAYVDKYRNEEEKATAKKLEIKDTEEQIKECKEYLKRLIIKLEELKR